MTYLNCTKFDLLYCIMPSLLCMYSMYTMYDLTWPHLMWPIIPSKVDVCIITEWPDLTLLLDLQYKSLVCVFIFQMWVSRQDQHRRGEHYTGPARRPLTAHQGTLVTIWGAGHFVYWTTTGYLKIIPGYRSLFQNTGIVFFLANFWGIGDTSICQVTSNSLRGNISWGGGFDDDVLLLDLQVRGASKMWLMIPPQMVLFLICSSKQIQILTDREFLFDMICGRKAATLVITSHLIPA